MARRFERQRSDRVPVWFGTRLQSTAAGGAGSTLLTVLNAGALALRPFTIIRTRLLIQIQSDQTVTSEAVAGVYARIVVSNEAADAGINSISTPIAEPDASFMVYQPLIANFTFISGVGVESRVGFQYTVDSKAMRKIGLQDDLVGVIELGGASEGALIMIEGRMLVKLH